MCNKRPEKVQKGTKKLIEFCRQNFRKTSSRREGSPQNVLVKDTQIKNGNLFSMENNVTYRKLKKQLLVYKTKILHY